MNNNNTTNTQKESLLPPPELLERYEAIYPGFSKDLVEIIKKEQEHRHILQKKYLMHFRLGQIFGSFFLVAVICGIWYTLPIDPKLSYIMTGVFGFLILLILLQYKKDKLSAIIRNSKKSSISTYKPHYSSYKKTHYQQHKM